MVTIQYSDLLFTVITISVVCVSIAVVIGMLRLRLVLQRVDRVMQEAETLAPSLDRLLQESERTLRATRQLSERATDIAEDVEALTTETRLAAAPLIRELGHHADNAFIPLRQLSALIVGTKAGLAALGRDR
jgi:ABC-type transporter Mla subunit MlaD